MQNKTPDDFKARLTAAMSNPTFQYLYDRWLDEREYEDIEEYGKAFAKATGLTVERCTKRPFGFVVSDSTIPGALYHISATTKNMQWKRIA